MKTLGVNFGTNGLRYQFEDCNYRKILLDKTDVKKTFFFNYFGSTKISDTVLAKSYLTNLYSINQVEK